MPGFFSWRRGYLEAISWKTDIEGTSTSLDLIFVIATHDSPFSSCTGAPATIATRIKHQQQDDSMVVDCS
ncbi:hypothetical protein C0Q70_03554 [Pomacea canaliculata]|uniref:Uncharacterized protein n=1 Tax=Pomacea canaliculata TaxID=400727 RepID=A0A2T7PT30_POMCA|nr:hypothetical protein C0Q70_03554 [Pomacea canaliculata]